MPRVLGLAPESRFLWVTRDATFCAVACKTRSRGFRAEILSHAEEEAGGVGAALRPRPARLLQEAGGVQLLHQWPTADFQNGGTDGCFLPGS